MRPSESSKNSFASTAILMRRATNQRRFRSASDTVAVPRPGNALTKARFLFSIEGSST